MNKTLQPGIDFSIPDDYLYHPAQEYIEAGYFVLTDSRTFPDGVVRYRAMVTDSGIEFLRGALRSDQVKPV
jgi:hypothetical protein